ncbi:MAG TPA: hypothetical protein VKX39_07650 [Bryobacteraceae bacterium]|jgi:hypothetical protein|nr:hypothetical protein [Bryobacteraceae bacterium]
MRRLLIFAGCVAGFAAAQNADFPSGVYEPISGGARVTWAVRDTLGLPSLAGGLVSAGWGTLLDRPPEYGTHALGFAKRYGMRMTGVATESAMEASLGALWGEDPRYFRDVDAPFGHRLRHVIKFTFLAENPHGELRPAYARYAAMSGSNFLSNAWRADSEANTTHAIERIGLGFLGRLSKNAAIEFWPDIRAHVFHYGR